MGCLVENPSQSTNTNNQNDKTVGSGTERRQSSVNECKHHDIVIESTTMADGGINQTDTVTNHQEIDINAETDIDREASNNNALMKYEERIKSDKSAKDVNVECANNNTLENLETNIERETENSEANAEFSARKDVSDNTIECENKCRTEESKDETDANEANNGRTENEITTMLDPTHSDISEEENIIDAEGGDSDSDIHSEAPGCERYTYEPIDVEEAVLIEIENKLDQLKDIPELCYAIPIESFTEDTQHRLCYHLDPESHVTADSGKSKDYLGLGEWIDLEPLFMRYLHRTMMKLKTIEVLGKWITSDKRPHPTIGNFVDCMCGEDGIDRPDVVMDLAKHITKDAIAWVRTGSEACTAPQTKTDKSWQLTRHDVVTGKKTYYTSCLVYADEDEGMAQIITKLYKSVCKQALFFLPQFDLKIGKYEFDTTAKVIQERCEGRVIFILSEYFFASEVCRFAVQFSRAMDAAADAGNMIPFHLTNKYDHVPRVLKGISGIRWFRRAARKMSWATMTDTILGGRMEAEQLERLKYRLLEYVEKEASVYLGDPPYDEDTPSPGPPIEVNDPPLTGELRCYDPSTYFDQSDQELLASARPEESTSKVSKLLKRVKTRAVNAFHKLLKKKSRSDTDKCSTHDELEKDPRNDRFSMSTIASNTSPDTINKGFQTEEQVYNRSDFVEASNETIDGTEKGKETQNKKDNKE